MAFRALPCKLAILATALHLLGPLAPTEEVASRPPSAAVCSLYVYPYAMAFSPDSRFLAVSIGGKRAFRVWDVTAGHVIKTIEESEESLRTDPFASRVPRSILDMAWLPDGRGLVTCDEAGLVALWDVDEGKEVARFGSNRFLSRYVAVTRDGSLVAAANIGSHCVYVWSTETQQQIDYFKVRSEPYDLSFSGDGTVMAVSTSREIEIRDVRCGVTYDGPPNVGDDSLRMEFAPGRNDLAVLNLRAGSIEIWEMSRRQSRLEVYVTGARSVAYSPDERWLAVAGSRGVDIIQATSGKRLIRYTDHQPSDEELRRVRGRSPRRPISVAFSPDGSWLASLDNRGQVHLRSVKRLLSQTALPEISLKEEGR